MKVTIPIMIQDPATAAYKGMATEENVRIEADFFLDGPVTKKVALIDFDPETGQIAPPAGSLSRTLVGGSVTTTGRTGKAFSRSVSSGR
jgi:hypothetical protein